MAQHPGSSAWPAPMPASVGLAAGRHHVDYALARRSTLEDLRTGRREREDVCDAHPELLRAARHVGDCIDADCPVCGHASLRLVSYVYGDGLRHANGRCIASEAELTKLEREHDEFSRYVVEVCLDCSWNHLTRHELHGRRSQARRAKAR